MRGRESGETKGDEDERDSDNETNDASNGVELGGTCVGEEVEDSEGNESTGLREKREGKRGEERRREGKKV